jgi:hypothetical protein
VLSDPQSLITELLRRANGPHMPDVVLLDDEYGVADVDDDEDAEPQYLALDTMRRLSAEWALDDLAPLPPIVLYSSLKRLETLDRYAFCRLGGAHVIDKGMEWSKRIELLWRVIDGERWQHVGRPPRVEFYGPPWQAAILPALEAGLANDEAAAWLAAAPLHPRARTADGDHRQAAIAAYRNAVSALGQNPQLLVHVHALHPAWNTGHSKRTLALAAVRAGWLWIPLRHQELFPPDRTVTVPVEVLGSSA